jgi:hypothetical protein
VCKHCLATSPERRKRAQRVRTAHVKLREALRNAGGVSYNLNGACAGDICPFGCADMVLNSVRVDPVVVANRSVRRWVHDEGQGLELEGAAAARAQCCLQPQHNVLALE